MPNTDQWVNRTEIRSETSNRVYVVSQHAAKRYWACSCPGWRTHRKCKHLERLGLPCGEVPFEVAKDHARKKGFLDGYPTYDDSAGRGNKEDWQRSFARRMGLDEAREELGLPETAGWDEVRRACQLAATESLKRLVGEYEAAVRSFSGPGPEEKKAEAVKAAKFRLEAYAAYLEDQRQRLEAESERVTRELLTTIEAM